MHSDAFYMKQGIWRINHIALQSINGVQQKICQKLICGVSFMIAQVCFGNLSANRNCLRILILMPCLLELESVDYSVYGDDQYDDTAGLACHVVHDGDIEKGICAKENGCDAALKQMDENRHGYDEHGIKDNVIVFLFDDVQYRGADGNCIAQSCTGDDISAGLLHCWGLKEFISRHNCPSRVSEKIAGPFITHL